MTSLDLCSSRSLCAASLIHCPDSGGFVSQPPEEGQTDVLLHTLSFLQHAQNVLLWRQGKVLLILSSLLPSVLPSFLFHVSSHSKRFMICLILLPLNYSPVGDTQHETMEDISLPVHKVNTSYFGDYIDPRCEMTDTLNWSDTSARLLSGWLYHNFQQEVGRWLIVNRCVTNFLGQIHTNFCICCLLIFSFIVFVIFRYSENVCVWDCIAQMGAPVCHIIVA